MLANYKTKYDILFLPPIHRSLKSLEAAIFQLPYFATPLLNNVIISVGHIMHNITQLIVKRMINYYFRKTILSVARFIKVIVMRLKLETQGNLFKNSLETKIKKIEFYYSEVFY